MSKTCRLGLHASTHFSCNEGCTVVVILPAARIWSCHICKALSVHVHVPL